MNALLPNRMFVYFLNRGPAKFEGFLIKKYLTNTVQQQAK